MLNSIVSPTRQYVALIVLPNGEHAFRKFTLPEIKSYVNDTRTAEWHYLNRLDLFSVLVGCLTFENYQNLKEVETIQERFKEL